MSIVYARPSPHPSAWSLLGAWYRLADALGIALALAISVVSAGRSEPSTSTSIAAAVAIIVYGMLAELGDMYRSWRGVSAHREAMGTLVCWSCTAVTLLALGFVTKHTAEFSRISMVTWFAVAPVLILAGRIATRRMQRISAFVGLPYAEVRHRRRQRVGIPVGAEHRGLARDGTVAWRASSTIGPITATPTFPPTSAAAWERSKT